MSDKWPETSNEVHILKFEDRGAPLSSCFPHIWWIKGHFLYPPAGAFANPPAATEGAHLPNPRPLRAVTSTGKEILYLSSEESIRTSNGELSSWSNICAETKQEEEEEGDNYRS
ncbi:hypothetical protein Hanom_Chr08g00757441 [Helianthus anomalus]